MRIEILIEDQSGKKMLKALIPEIVKSDAYTINVHAYKGKGHLPKKYDVNAKKIGRNLLLNNLPATLRSLGKTFSKYPDDQPTVVIVVCDLDTDNRGSFLNNLNNVLNQCNPKPDAHFCLAIEEGEAWLLGDLKAVKAAYPEAKDSVLNGYQNDSICGTWELLADAVYPGGSVALKGKGPQAGWEKAKWAEKITPLIDVDNNKSPSFIHFRGCLRQLANNHT